MNTDYVCFKSLFKTASAKQKVTMRSIIVISMLVVALAHYGASARRPGPSRSILKLVKEKFPDTKEKLVESGLLWKIAAFVQTGPEPTKILNALYQEPGKYEWDSWDEDYREKLIDGIVNNERIFDKIKDYVLADGGLEKLGLKGEGPNFMKNALRKTLEGLGKDKPATTE